MRGVVIKIKFSRDLATDNQNELRYRMELAAWKQEQREAKANEDFAKLEYLERSFEYLGLP